MLMALLVPSVRAGLYLAALGALAITLVISAHVVQSKFGRLLIAIRDAESRVRFLGYGVTAFKLFVFVLSAMMGGRLFGQCAENMADFLRRLALPTRG